jgi:mxaJ protein
MKRALTLLLVLCAASASARELRVCADPNNLPYSNERGEGFENRIATLLARDLGARVEYVWWAQRRGFLRNTLLAGKCDVVMGVASSIGMVATTDPYYRSSYVFVSRRDRNLAPQSLDDPRLRELTLGVQLVGDDGANTPPAHALARRGIVDNVRGYPVYGDYAQQAPQLAPIQAVARGDVDMAIVWGPTAGYFSALQSPPLVLQNVRPWLDGPQWPMVFETSIGLRKDDRALRRELNAALRRNATAIAAILDGYHVPRVDIDPGQDSAVLP